MNSSTEAQARTDHAIQVHLRLNESDIRLLKRLAAERDQTVSATVRFLLRHYLRTASGQFKDRDAAHGY